MRTRRDQVQAYRFVTRRIVSALLSGDPETPNLPMRRLGLAVVGSVVAAAVVLGGAGAYGLLTGNAAPLEENTLVIERETGATYVYVEGLLHPTLNYASARLILNEAEPTVRTMSQASIADRPRGRIVGIVGAPDALPDRGSLVELPWSVCTVPNSADPRRATTHLAIDRPLSGGAPLGDRAVLATVGGERYLLTGGARLRIVGGDPAIAALRMAGATSLNVGDQLLNAVPAGPTLREPSIPGRGELSQLTLGDGQARVGQVYRAAGRHYVLTREGLASIGEVTALLLLRKGGEVIEITPDQAGRLLLEQRLDQEGIPQTLPELHPVRTGQTVLCATYREGPPGAPPVTTVEVFDRVPPELTGPATPVRQGAGDSVRTAEQVLLSGGRGVLAQAAPGAGEGGTGARGATVHLITAQGVRFPLAADAVAALGYGDVVPLAVPASLLSLIPTGPTLNRKDALAHFAPGGSGRAPSAGATRTPAPGTSRSASPTPGAEPTRTPTAAATPTTESTRTPTADTTGTPNGEPAGTDRATTSPTG